MKVTKPLNSIILLSPKETQYPERNIIYNNYTERESKQFLAQHTQNAEVMRPDLLRKSPHVMCVHAPYLIDYNSAFLIKAMVQKYVE